MDAIRGRAANSVGDSEVMEVRCVLASAVAVVERNTETLALVADMLDIASIMANKNSRTIESIQRHVETLTMAIEVTLRSVNSMQQKAPKLKERSSHLERWVYQGNQVQRDTKHMSGCRMRTCYVRMGGYEHGEVEHSRKRGHTHMEAEHKYEQHGGECEHTGMIPFGCQHEGSQEHECEREHMLDEDVCV